MSRFCAIVLLLLISCSSAELYRKKLVPSNRNAATTGPYGAYVEVTCNKGIIMGEYIAYQNDSLYVLGQLDMQVVSLEEVHYLNLVLTRTRTKGYAITTGIAVTPALIGAIAHSDYSGEFLSLAGITAATGLLATLIESQRKAQVEHYDGTARKLQQSVKYARFPKGVPNSVNPHELQRIK